MKATFDYDDELLAFAAWSRLAEPGDQAALALVTELGASNALKWLAAGGQANISSSHPWHDRWHKGLARWSPRLETLNPRRELEVIADLGGGVIIPTDPLWPLPLADLGLQMPMCLWYRGDITVLTPNRLSVAIVGARASTAYGNLVSDELAAGCAGHNMTVISGGAFGIDIAAHRGALQAGGKTISVSAGGLDRLYPQGNARLLTQVINHGLMIAEAPPGTAPMRQRFLQRNRLIAALAQTTIVVEAAWRSGALSTAYRAAELMRGVGAVPGPVTSVASQGCHRLIREGAAICVTGIDDVKELVGAYDGQLPLEPGNWEQPPGELDGLDPVAARVYDGLPKFAATDVDSLVIVSGCSSAQVLRALGKLLRLGRVEQHSDKWRRVRVAQT